MKHIILGNEFQIKNFDLIEDKIDIKKLFITKEKLNEIYSESKLIDYLKEDVENYVENILELKREDVDFNDNFNEEFKEKIRELLDLKIDSELKSSLLDNLTNSKFTVAINYGIGQKKIEFVEFSILRNMLNKLLFGFCDFYQKNKNLIKNFHIEIYESFDVSKTILIQKNQTSFEIYSLYGHNENYLENNLNLGICGEIYISKEDNFKFFKNKQKTIFLKDRNGSMKNFEMHSQNKILTNEDLEKINDITKDLQYLFLEILVTKDNKFLISNFMEKNYPITIINENGFCITKKSLKEFEINLVKPNEENLDDTASYIFIDNKNDFLNFLKNIENLKKYSGVICCINFYSKFVFEICDKFNLDFIYVKEVFLKYKKYIINLDNISFKEKVEKIENQNSFENFEYSDFKNFNKKKSTFEMLSENAKKYEKELEERKNINDNENIQTEKENINDNEFEEKEENENKEISFDDFEKNFQSQAQIFSDKNENETIFENENLEKYDNILSTNIFTNPNIQSKNFFCDYTNLNNFDYCENLFYFSNSKTKIEKDCKKINYLYLYDKNNFSNEDYILINTINDFFELEEGVKKVFFNLVNIEEKYIKNFLKLIFEKFEKVSFLCKKENLFLFEKNINKIENIFIKDLENDNEFENCKNEILKYEKNYLMNKN